MKIAVVGLWHLGLVTAAGLSSLNFSITAYDPDKKLISQLKENKLPIVEPGLSELITLGIEKNNLYFTDERQNLNQADIVWVTFDTPVDEHDHADSEVVIRHVEMIVPYLKQDSVILISSQLPIGSTNKIKLFCQTHYAEKNISVAYSPENLRLGKALEIFLNQDRIVVGTDSNFKNILSPVLDKLTEKIIWMSIESAEMTKHALNSFLANSIVFINEISTLCEYTGADATEVAVGLKSESRIGPRAYLQPGAAIAGGTLLRDVTYINEIARANDLTMPLMSSILESNRAHKNWAIAKLKMQLVDLDCKKIVMCGLSYKVGTDTLRRSISVELAKLLCAEGAVIYAYDPDIENLPEELSNIIVLEKELKPALHYADALLILKDIDRLSEIIKDNNTILSAMKQFLIIDPNGYIQNTFKENKHIQYHTMGKATQ